MFSRPGVLIVDRSAETREVLRTALAERGTEIWAASGADEGLELARRHSPDVIVLDVELAQAASEAVRAGFNDASRRRVPLVLLGRARRLAQNFPGGEIVAKPYHYAPLIRKIERLLEETRRGVDSGPRVD